MSLAIPKIDTIDDYQIATEGTAIYQDSVLASLNNYSASWILENYLKLAYCTMKLTGESGEVAELIGKALRDDGMRITPERMDALKKELGDVLWYISQLCNELGFSLQTVMQMNVNKLYDRKDRGVLHGSGDTR